MHLNSISRAFSSSRRYRGSLTVQGRVYTFSSARVASYIIAFGLIGV